MTIQIKQSIVELSQSNIRQGEAHDYCNTDCNANSSSIANSIYFMSKPRFKYYAFFRFMPSVRVYYRILKAIEKSVGTISFLQT